MSVWEPRDTRVVFLQGAGYRMRVFGEMARAGSRRHGTLRLVGATLGFVFVLGGGAARALTITPTFDSSWNTAPTGDLAAAEASFAAVDALYAAAFSNPVTVNIDVSWGLVGAQTLPGNALGATSINYSNSSLGQIETLLASASAANPANAALATAVQHLPASVSGPSFILPDAQYEALTGISLSGYQAYIGFGTGVNWQFSQAGGIAPTATDFTAVVAHEVSHALGRVSYEFQSPVPNLTPLDLYRYNCNATTLNDTSNTTACFSINGGATDLGTFSNASDSADWYGPSGTGTDAFDAYLAPGVTALVTPVDYTLLASLGYNPVPEPSAAIVLGVGLVSLGVCRRGLRRRSRVSLPS